MNSIEKPSWSRAYVENQMKEKIIENAKKEGISVEEYKIRREERKRKAMGKNPVLENIYTLKQKYSPKMVEIDKVSQHNGIKWGKITLKVKERDIRITAFINDRKKGKPQILWEMDKLTFVEKKKVRSYVYWYFGELQKS